MCWGDGDKGQLGNGQWIRYTSPTPVLGGHSFTQIATGYRSTCAITSDGTVWCFGWNNLMQLGDCTTTDRNIPVQVKTSKKFSFLAASNGSFCGLLVSTREPRCWGENPNSELGPYALELDCTQQPPPPPVAQSPPPPPSVQLSMAIARLGAGADHACFIPVDGPNPVCWGLNGNGQVGDGTTVNAAVPKDIGEAFASMAVPNGSFHTCALKADGSALCHGDNNNGQLGTGDFTSSSTPIFVAGGLKFVAISCGQRHTCGLTGGGEIWCWGYVCDIFYSVTLLTITPPRFLITLISSPCRWNYDGQLGLGSYSSHNTPQRVTGGHTWKQLSVNGINSCALLTSGKAMCWGWNHRGKRSRI